MNSISAWFSRLFKKISNLIRKIKNLYNEDRRKFWEVYLKFLFSILYFVILFIPFYSTEFNGTINGINLFDNGAWFIYLLIYISLPIAYINYALNFSYKTANKVYKIQSILSIIMFAYNLLTFFSDKNDYPIVSFSLNLGFYLSLVTTTIIFLLAYYDKPFLNAFYKVFKIPDIIEVEYIN